MSLKHSGTRILFIDFFNKETKNKICTFFRNIQTEKKMGRKKSEKAEKYLNGKEFGQRKDSGPLT